MWKEVVRYLFIAICVLVIFLIVANTQLFKINPPQQGIFSDAQGRFVLKQISDFRRDQYMIDTATGRLWVLSCEKEVKDNSDCGNMLLVPVSYVTLDGGEDGVVADAQVVTPLM
jgi:hypothetical protein